MTKEELEKYARENRKRLDAQEVKLGDVVKVLVGQFAGETGIIVGISTCHNDYTDPYYEVDMNCEVPEKYKCRKTLMTPNNVIGGLSAYEFEVIGNRAPKQPSMEIKQGDKVRVSKDAPRMYARGRMYALTTNACKVEAVEDDNAVISLGCDCFPIPTKYLVKVDAEAKEPKFKVGDRVRIKGDGYEPNLHKGDIGEILDTNDKEQCFVLFKKSQAWIYADCLEPYTEPTEQTEAEKKPYDGISEETANEISNMLEAYAKALSGIADSFNWQKYEADLAKEVALKVANKFNNPKQAAEYAVSVAKSVVEGLRKK